MKCHCQFVKLDPRAHIPFQATPGSVGLDLYILEDVTICSDSFMLLGTGLIAIPSIGTHFEIYLRSSTPKKYPGLILANHVGIVDSDYCGPNDEIKLALYNTSPMGYHISCDKPIAQLVVRENSHYDIKEISWERYQTYAISKKSRGGFGSTSGG